MRCPDARRPRIRGAGPERGRGASLSLMSLHLPLEAQQGGAAHTSLEEARGGGVWEELGRIWAANPGPESCYGRTQGEISAAKCPYWAMRKNSDP